MHMGNIGKDVLTKWRHGRRDVIVSAEGNYSLPSTLTYLCCACMTVYALFVFTALLSTHVFKKKPKSSMFLHDDTRCVCVYV